MSSPMYNAEAQKRYNEKSKKYAVTYRPKEMDFVDILESAIEKSGLSANAYIKQAIEEKLKKDGHL